MCIINNININSSSHLLNNIINGIQEGLIDDLIEEIINEEKDITKIENNNLYQLTSSFNLNNITKNKNYSIILLNECENIVKRNNNISESDALIVFKTEQCLEGMLIPLIEFDIFDPKTKKKLDLNCCKKNLINITIFIPVSINENILFKMTIIVIIIMIFAILTKQMKGQILPYMIDS